MVPIGCGPASESTQARSFSLTWKAAASRTGTVVSPRRALRGSPPARAAAQIECGVAIAGNQGIEKDDRSNRTGHRFGHAGNDAAAIGVTDWPVSVGANTMCPRALSCSATRRQAQPPCHVNEDESLRIHFARFRICRDCTWALSAKSLMLRMSSSTVALSAWLFVVVEIRAAPIPAIYGDFTCALL
jgi:hypothetical protein